MTAIFYTIGGAEYMLRNIVKWQDSYSEEIKTYQNESGNAIVYPVRCGKHSISLKIEANSMYLSVLKSIFTQPVVHLKYTHGSDADTDCIGNIAQEIHEADFVKSGNITISQIADIKTALPNAGMSCTYGKLGKYDRFGRGAYEVSVTLEEV